MNGLEPLRFTDDAMMFIRPEAFHIAEAKTRSDTRIRANVQHSEFEGQSYNVFLEGDAGKEIKMSLINRGETRLYEPGVELVMQYDASQAVVVPAGELASE